MKSQSKYISLGHSAYDIIQQLIKYSLDYHCVLRIYPGMNMLDEPEENHRLIRLVNELNTHQLENEESSLVKLKDACIEIDESILHESLILKWYEVSKNMPMLNLQAESIDKLDLDHFNQSDRVKLLLAPAVQVKKDYQDLKTLLSKFPNLEYIRITTESNKFEQFGLLLLDTKIKHVEFVNRVFLIEDLTQMKDFFNRENFRGRGMNISVGNLAYLDQPSLEMLTQAFEAASVTLNYHLDTHSPSLFTFHK
ncbi:MAG TPA: hypothetical protein QF353_06040 [Gammaproteobacteria bacterium]|nr:hypothetical protein [Gammaproteobacteria bacterium]